MPHPYEISRLSDLRRLAAVRYGSLNKAETAVLELSVLSDRPDVAESGVGERPEVGAEFLYWLATDKAVAPNIDPLGVRVDNSTLPRLLNLSFCKIPFPFEFWFCTLKAGLWMQWAEIPGIYLAHCVIGDGLGADGARVSGDMTLLNCLSEQRVGLAGAHVSGDLNCASATFSGKPDALDASRAQITGNLYFNEGRITSGTVRLDNAELGGDVYFSGATFAAPGDALSAIECKIVGSLYLNSSSASGFSSTGTIHLEEIEIGRDLDCSAATLTGTPSSLLANSAKLSNVFLQGGFSSTGHITLLGAEINGDLNCSGAQKFNWLLCDHMRVGRSLIYSDIVSPEEATIQLYGANVGTLHDDEKSWNQVDLRLDGFVYQELVLHERATPQELKKAQFGSILPTDSCQRIRWLRLQPETELSSAQPWMQLAKFLQTMGDIDGAKHVVYEFHRQRARRSLWRPLSFAYDQIEENPLRVGWPITLFWGVGSLVFWRAYRMGAMKPSLPPGTVLPGGGDTAPGTSASADVTPFQPVVYALENVLPVVKLGQDSAWSPDPTVSGSMLPEGKVKSFAERWWVSRQLIRLNYTRLAWLRWLLILVGWALALVLAAAIGEQFKR